MGRRWKVLLVTSAARQRAAATALWIAAVGVAAATGPVLGGALVDWQGFLGISILVAVLAAPASPGRWLPSTRRGSWSRPPAG